MSNWTRKWIINHPRAYGFDFFVENSIREAWHWRHILTALYKTIILLGFCSVNPTKKFTKRKSPLFFSQKSPALGGGYTNQYNVRDFVAKYSTRSISRDFLSEFFFRLSPLHCLREGGYTCDVHARLATPQVSNRITIASNMQYMPSVRH